VDSLAGRAQADPAVVELPFRLVESSISIRSDEGRSPKWAAKVFPVAALQVLGWSGDIGAVADAAAELPEADGVSD
jgi:hypothetical protein